MFSLSGGILLIVYLIYIIAHVFGKINRHIDSFAPISTTKETETEEKISIEIEDMYSPHNNIKDFYKAADLYCLTIENKTIKEDLFVYGYSLKELKAKTIDGLKKLADIENGKADKSIL